MTKKLSVKNILFCIGTFILGVGLGFLVWLTFMGGSKEISRESSIPTEATGAYSGYYYTKLDKDEKIAYELIMKEIEDMPEKIEIPNLVDDYEDLFEAIVYDNPEYFFLSVNFKVETNSFGKCYFIPQYETGKKEYGEQLAELQKVRDIIFEKAEGKNGDYELEKVVHDYIVNRCEYVEKTGGTYSSAYGCLVRGFASCEGYAKAMKYMLDELGLESYLVSGTVTDDEGKNIGHAWNMVKIDGEFYHVDPTWDDPISDTDENHYAFFNITDREIELTHHTDERFLGKCISTKANYYVKENLVFSKYDGEARTAVAEEFVKQAELEENIVSFKFTNKEAFQDAKESLFDLQGVYSVLMTATVLTDKTLSDKNIQYVADDKKLIIDISGFLADV